MIDPLTGIALDSALGGITSAMAGQTATNAYNSRMTGSYTDSSGVVIGVGNYVDDIPAITGNTNNTVTDSSKSDPQEAWLDWMHDGGLVDETTGGAEIGSHAGTFNYSIAKDANDTLKAVQPVAVPVDQAYVALAQALGVSMKISEIDPVLGNKFATALTAAGVVYSGAQNLVTAWWDGLHILFPKAAIDAIQALLQAEDIGQPQGYTSDLDTYQWSKPIAAYSSIKIVDGSYWIEYTGDSGVMFFACWYNNTTYIVACAGTTGKKYYMHYPSGVTVPVEIRNYNYRTDEKTVYWNYSNYSASSPTIILPSPTVLSSAPSDGATSRGAWTVIYGTALVNYPTGTYQSEAPESYTPSTIPPGPSILGRTVGGGVEDVIDTIILHLPDDPYNTKGDTEDPAAGTADEDKDALPAPPLDLPIPKTGTSDPDIPLVGNPSQVGEEIAELINDLVEDLANTVDPQPPQSSGQIPIPPFMPGTPVDPTDPSAGSLYPSYVPASGSGLIHVYNPTPAEFVAFGQWLWVTYADATIDKIWNNPFDGIIGAHELYATPQTDGSDNIRSGFLVCPTTSALVRQRYTEIDCGTVVVPEFYGNYFDYSPYSQCYIYLPFIGINEVSIDDIVGHAVNIRYRIDAYTGSCIAMIYVAKRGYRNLCYQYGGNCAVEVPLAGGSQAAIKAGVLQAEAYARATVQSAQIQKTASIGTGIVNGASSGSGAGAMNPVAGIVGGLLGALAGGTSGYIQGSADYGAAKLNAGAMQEAARYANKSSVQHSGQFGASHGAMGLKTPFIMIRNPIQVKVVNYNLEYGFPAHKRVIIGGCTGYLRVREVNVISAHATNEEKIAIETALKEGVYVT